METKNCSDLDNFTLIYQGELEIDLAPDCTTLVEIYQTNDSKRPYIRRELYYHKPTKTLIKSATMDANRILFTLPNNETPESISEYFKEYGCKCVRAPNRNYLCFLEFDATSIHTLRKIIEVVDCKFNHQSLVEPNFIRFYFY